MCAPCPFLLFAYPVRQAHLCRALFAGYSFLLSLPAMCVPSRHVLIAWAVNAITVSADIVVSVSYPWSPVDVLTLRTSRADSDLFLRPSFSLGRRLAVCCRSTYLFSTHSSGQCVFVLRIHDDPPNGSQNNQRTLGRRISHFIIWIRVCCIDTIAGMYQDPNVRFTVFFVLF